MSHTAKQHVADRAKKLRCILRDHYTRDDLSLSLERLLADAQHLAKQRSLDFIRITHRAGVTAGEETHEAQQ